MSSNVEFTLNKSAGADILRNNTDIQQIQRTTMQSILNNIEAQFFQTFGVEGTFDIKEFTTDRSSIKISAADAKTASVLKAAPKWLNTFLDNITI